MRRFVFTEGSSNKFWEITVSGRETTVCFGKVGTAGRATTKLHDSPAMAEKAAAALVAEKTKKGYREELAAPAAEKAGGSGAAAPAAPGDAGDPEGDEVRRFAFRDLKAGEIWALELRGAELVVRAGKLGAEPETTRRRLASVEAAEAEAVGLVAKRTGEQTDEYFQEEDPPLPYPFQLGDHYWDVGAQGNKVAVHFGEQTGRRQTPVETQWTRFATAAAAKAAEQRIRKLMDGAVDAGVRPDAARIAELLGDAAPQEPAPLCRECAELAQKGVRAPSASSSSAELTFSEHATPLIVAGQLLVVGVAPEVLRELCERVDAFAKERDIAVALVAQAPPSWPAEGVMGRELVLGRVVAVGNHHEPTKLSLEGMRQALKDAGKLPWAELRALLDDARLKPPDGLEWESSAEPDDEVRLRVFATGPLASGLVGFGVPTRDPESGEGEGAGDPSGVVPGLEEIWGQDMDQKRAPLMVYGEHAGVCDFHDNAGPDVVEVSAAAHKARAAKLGKLAKKADYYLVGRYD
jgi:predicted DNA-binding WGR domain protein